MRKVIYIVISLSVILVIFSGCSFSAEHTGGINLNDVEILSSGINTVITLSFINGSNKDGYPESKISRLPTYEVSSFDQPHRLSVTLHGLSFWDYNDPNWDARLVSGIFNVAQVGQNSLVLFFQLSSSADYAIKEMPGELQITLTPGEENDDSKYFCMSDSFSEYQKGNWPSDIPMTPVLCSDYENKLLISKPFDTLNEANTFMESANAELKNVLPEKISYIVQLSGDSLPDYTYYTSTGKVNNDVVLNNGEPQKTALLLNPGKYLATSKDGNILFLKNTNQTGDDNSLPQTLWVLQDDGKIYKLSNINFNSISNAAFSSDGRYAAILDTSFEDSILYVYDFSSKRLINIGEEGFGVQTESFAWSGSGDVLYAITGDDTTEIMSCSFDSGGDTSFKTLRDLTSPEGVIGISNSELFFSENGYDQGEIYELGDPDRDITSGTDFSISPDGKNMLILESSTTDSDDVLTSLKLYDIQTGKSEYIIENTEIYGFCFSADGSKVYYTEMDPDDESSDHPYSIYSYDIAGKSLTMAGTASTGDIYAGKAENEIYLVSDINIDEEDYYETYIYDVTDQDGGQDAGNN